MAPSPRFFDTPPDADALPLGCASRLVRPTIDVEADLAFSQQLADEEWCAEQEAESLARAELIRTHGIDVARLHLLGAPVLA